ncbi:MAG TPA: SUMF1/EgtB/PvdO family nonheme iron enzyme, partial [Polyangiaceae bacterium]|nr:SUMF1/EgtB/PvdO family nonheme iron enzyme [Polyangiaceae bacterium]
MRSLRWLLAGASAACAAGLLALGSAYQGPGDRPGERPEASALAAPSRHLTLALPFGHTLLRQGHAAAAPATSPPPARPPADSPADSPAGPPADSPAPAPGAERARADGAARGPCPDEGMARVGAACIDRYEAHLVARGPNGGERPWPHQLRPEPGLYYESRSKAGAYPQGYVSRAEASSACANAGKRLCTLAEWRRACQGARAAAYPYGAPVRPGACNTGKPHLLTKWYGADPYAWTYENFNSPTLNLEPGFLARGGEYEACRSEDGVYDLVGNLHEWVSDPVPLALVTRAPDENGAYPPQSVRPGNGIFVGGFFSTTNQNG